MTTHSALLAISPVDGRYAHQTIELQDYFSEFALIKYRVLVEVEYLIALRNIPLPQLAYIPLNEFEKLKTLYENFKIEDALRVKEIEKTTNHDVKAVEYFIKETIKGTELEPIQEFVHFGLTSQDINNTAIPLALMGYVYSHFLISSVTIVENLRTMALANTNVVMMAYTHGQPATPTTLGKELMVFVERLSVQLGQLEKLPHSAKFGGATGAFNAHKAAYPEIDWVEFGRHFVEDILNLKRSVYTTQIEHYDNLASMLDAMKRTNTILVDFCRDVWQYISMGYFSQVTKANEVGSSAMPHKVNPIDFENAEGNLLFANAQFEFLAAKLPVSRLQRDLTDSTVLRNLGMPMAHTYIAFKSILKGLEKISVNHDKITADLKNNYAVVSEAIQTILKREGVTNPYDILKQLTRGNAEFSQADIANLVQTLNISEEAKTQIMNLSPENYRGVY